MELESSASCDVMLHNAYLVSPFRLGSDAPFDRFAQLDTSKLIMEWVLREKFALVDLNLFPKPVEKHNVTVSCQRRIRITIVAQSILREANQ